jgi:hypothetical protein
MCIKAVSILGITSALVAFALIIYWMVDGNRTDEERHALIQFASCVHLLIEETPADESTNRTPAEHIEQCRVTAGIAFEQVTPIRHKLYFR